LHFYVGDRKKKHSGDKLSKRFQNIYSSSWISRKVNKYGKYMSIFLLITLVIWWTSYENLYAA
jgi:hypothetical protein